MIGKKRRQQLDQFHKDVGGNYVYDGSYQIFVDTGRSYRKTMALLWCACGAVLGLSVVCGCIPAAGVGRCFYVLIPYAMELVAAIALCWALSRMTAGGEKLRAYDHEKTAAVLPNRAVLVAAFAGVTLVGECVYLLLNGFEDRLWGTVVFLLAQAVILAAALFLRQTARSIRWTEGK